MATTKSLADKAISIKGKDYIQVKDRVQYLSDNFDGRYSLQSEYEYFESRKMWVVRATLTIWDKDHKEFSVFNGLAQEIESDDIKKVNFSAALENAETSAWGRACAAAGIGIDVTGGIASANEMQKAMNRVSNATDQPFHDGPSNPEPEWFEKAKANTDFMTKCLDEEDFINKIKNRVSEIGAKMTKQQETDLRISYNNVIKLTAAIDNLPFE